MHSNDKRLIRGYACGREDYREKAVEAYRRALKAGETPGPHMRFMSEIDNAVPDLALRARYRQEVKDTPIEHG